ncbi:MAG: hypothetical protein QOG69_502 [Actinomycetota bacterium]|nr:hypothetical protein [Actinomycetota bacterium]
MVRETGPPLNHVRGLPPVWHDDAVRLRSAGVRFGAVLVLAFAFGVFAAWAKGQNTDGVHGTAQLRSVLGNLSTPWLLVGFFAGAQFARLRDGALFGLLATLSALVGFYLLSTLVENLGGHGFVGDLRLELSGNLAYFEGGVVTGPLFGAVGVWWQRRRTTRAAFLVGALLIAEPVLMVALGAAGPHVMSGDTGLPLIARIVPGWGLTAQSGSTAWAVYGAEFGLGLGVVLLTTTRRHRRSA